MGRDPPAFRCSRTNIRTLGFLLRHHNPKFNLESTCLDKVQHMHCCTSGGGLTALRRGPKLTLTSANADKNITLIDPSGPTLVCRKPPADHRRPGQWVGLRRRRAYAGSRHSSAKPTRPRREQVVRLYARPSVEEQLEPTRR